MPKALSPLCSISVSVAHSGVCVEREKKKEKKIRKSPNQTTINARTRLLSPGQREYVPRKTRDIAAFSSQLPGEETP